MIASKPEESKEKARDTVADLERRLAMIGTNNDSSTEKAAKPEAPPAFATPPPATSNDSVKGGKNALLARIMAAQERAKQAQQAPPAAPPVDLLSGGTEDLPPPSIDHVSAPPPPAFDATVLPPQQQQQPPPMFDDSLLPPPPPPVEQQAPQLSFDPMAAPPAPSAPDFDLLAAYEHETTTTAALPAPVPPADTGMDQSAIEAILGMEGLSEAEKKALIEEQAKILANIEATKVDSKSAAANRFEQRSINAAVGANAYASQGGGAGIVTAEERAQMEADMKLAQELQNEEYNAADRAERRQQRQETAHQKAAAKNTSSASNNNGSWMEWLGLSSTAPAPPASSSSPERPAEDEALLNRRRPAAARVAESQPLFSCVADSITSVASTVQVAMHGDDEGNVHGVDSSGLLAMPQVGRDKSRDEDDTGYYERSS